MTLVIRKAVKSDYKQITELEYLLNEYMAKIATEEERVSNYKKLLEKYVKDMLNSKNSVFFICEDNGVLVAVLLGKLLQYPPVFKYPTYAYVDSFYVQKEYRTKGIGKKLIKELVKWSKSNGCKEISLNAHIKNQNALIAYEKLGFKHTRNVLKLYL